MSLFYQSHESQNTRFIWYIYRTRVNMFCSAYSIVRYNSVLWNCVQLCYICNEKPYTDRTKSSLCFIPSSDFIIGDNFKGGHYLMLHYYRWKKASFCMLCLILRNTFVRYLLHYVNDISTKGKIKSGTLPEFSEFKGFYQFSRGHIILSG